LKTKSNASPFIILIIIALFYGAFFFTWGTSLIKCDYLTWKYYSDFEYAYSSNTMLGDMEYFKVLECSDNSAKVYYVSKNMSGADVLTFAKINGKWTETRWNTIWSTTGSASEVIWPYWWHFIYGGF